MQTVSDRFHQLARASIVPLAWTALISFTKQRRQDVAWFTLDQSALDGSDMLSTLDNNPTQVWDAYEWLEMSDRLMDMTIERSVEFPYNVQASIADITLNNFDNYLTFAEEDTDISPISTLILPKRPLRLFLGFRTANQIPMFVGLTQDMPEYSEDSLQLKWTAIDFLSEIGDQELRSTIKLRDATTDQVIATILQQYGMTPEQYNLSVGQNTIPFVLFNKGDNAGNALKRLVQAENGALWLDEQGIIRFTTRTGVLGKQSVMIFDQSNIISIKPSRIDGIINHVKITSEVRAVQPAQPIFSIENADGFSKSATDDQWRIPANGTLDAWLSLEDPAWTTNDFVFNGANTNSSFTAKSLSGAAVTSGVSASGTLFQDSYKVTFTNTTGAPVSVDFMELWGEPAKVIDTINYEAYDDESQDKFGNKLLEITDNNFFGSYRNCDLLAMDILTKQSEYSPNIEIQAKGDPSLQLGDVITVDHKYPGDYLVTAIGIKLAKGMLETTIRAKKHTVVEPFVLDVSQLDGTDLLG